MKDLFIGIDMGGTNIRAGISSKQKGVISYKKERIIDINSKKKIINQLTRVVDSLFTKKIKGIGIGVPSILDINKGTIYEPNNISGLENINIKKIFEKRYNVPVSINNDANCFALGEKYFGSGKNYKNVVGLIIGTGFGAGIIIDNKLYCGDNCAAGEFGKIPFKDKTIEDYCSGKFFKKYKLSGEEIQLLAKKGNKRALAILKEFGKNLGLGVSAVVNSVDPEIIILGGGVSKSYKFFRDTFFKSLKEHSYKHVFRNLKIKISKLENVAILGAISLFYWKNNA